MTGAAAPRRAVVPALVAALALAGCGPAGDREPGRASEGASPTTTANGCGRATVGVATLLGRVDVLGDGRPAEIRYLGRRGGPCAGRVLVATGATVLSLDARRWILPPSRARAVHLPTREADLVLLTASHPRGALQARLLLVQDGRLVEVRDRGRPVLPLVVTDTGQGYLAARCRRDGFAVTTVRDHDPPGIVPAWDVWRVDYAADGRGVRRTDEHEVADNVLDAQVRRRFPALEQRRLFENC